MTPEEIDEIPVVETLNIGRNGIRTVYLVHNHYVFEDEYWPGGSLSGRSPLTPAQRYHLVKPRDDTVWFWTGDPLTKEEAELQAPKYEATVREAHYAEDKFILYFPGLEQAVKWIEEHIREETRVQRCPACHGDTVVIDYEEDKDTGEPTRDPWGICCAKSCKHEFRLEEKT